MWQLFCALGLYFSVYADMPHERVDASQMKLDPITVAGIVYIDLLKRRCKQDHMKDCVAFAMPALRLITEPLQPDLFTLKSDSCAQRFTAAKWNAHLEVLKEASMLVFCALPRLRHVARYFAVPKNEHVARAIWNGKVLTEHTKKAPPVNLPGMPDILRKMHDLSRKGNICLLTADFRHYFHTIKVSEELSRMFGVAVEVPGGGLRTYRWATLPMGWGPSPWIASSVGFAAILWRESGEEILFEVEPGLTQLPSFIPIKGGGFLCLYYDNILAVHTDFNILEKVQKRLNRNFSGTDHAALHHIPSNADHIGLSLLQSLARPYGAGVNIPLGKPIEMYSSKRLLSGDQAEYLGVAFSLRTKNKKRTPEDSTDIISSFHRLQHRQSRKKYEKWQQLDPQWEKVFCARELAAFIGKILWRHSITLRPLCAIAPVIEILRRLAKYRLSTRSTWDEKNFSLTPAEVLVMRRHWDLCLNNPWHESDFMATDRTTIRLVSDSSGNQWGYLVFTDEGFKAFERGHRWSRSLQKQHIFLKELCAAVFAIRHVLLTNRRSLDIHIGVDNSAAANALRNMYSGNLMACTILDRLNAELGHHDARIFVHSLRSEDNASDAASRGRLATEDDVRNCYEHLIAQEKGQRISMPDNFLQRAGLVHGETDLDESSIEDLLGLTDLSLLE